MALDQRDDGKADCNRQTRHERSDASAEPPACRLPAAGDELALLAGRSSQVPVLPTQPRFGLPEVGTSEEVAAVAVHVDPFADSPREPGVLVAPLQVDLERIQ